MDNLQRIQNDVPPNTIQIFTKQDSYNIYTHVAELKEHLRIYHESMKTLALNQQQYEKAVVYILLDLRLCIQEYSFDGSVYTLIKCSSPSNWSDHCDVIYESERIYPVSAVTTRVVKEIHEDLNATKKKKTSNTIYDFSFYDSVQNVLYETSFEDDDIHSNLFNLIAGINSREIVYNDLKLDKVFKNMDIRAQHINKKMKSIDLLKDHLLMASSAIPTENYDPGMIMKIDSKTLNGMNISLFIEKYLKTLTAQGKRQMEKIMRNPLINQVELERRHCAVDDLQNANLAVLRFFPDLLKYTRRILKLNISDIAIIHRTLLYSAELLGMLNNIRSNIIACDFVDILYNIQVPFAAVRNEIEKYIDLDTVTIKYEVNDTINALKEEKENILNEIKVEHQRVIGINKKIKLESRSNNEYLFKVPRSEYKNFKENFFVEKQILKSGILFTTRRLEDMNVVHNKLVSELKKEERVILDNLLTFINQYTVSIEVMNHIVGVLDVYYTFSKLKDHGFTRPMFSDGVYSIEKGWHPLVKECISNSITLRGDNTEKEGLEHNVTEPVQNINTASRFCVVTGPNMGGKSTFLKMCGLISFLAQTGCPVPCERAFIPIIDGIYIRIGASDVASKGLSTFMVEMIDMARICGNATNSSLVLIDELGRGTSAIDGLSIAMSIKEYLLKVGCVTLFATHFPELCDNTVVNKRVKCAIGDEVTLLYEIEDGICDISFGIEVAKRVKFPDEVVEQARLLLNEIDK